MLNNLGGNNLPSRFEEEVLEALTDEIGLPNDQIAQQVVIAGTPVDMVIGDLIIECDGDKWHYSEGPDGGILLGGDYLQDRLFARAGYSVIHIRNEEYHGPNRTALLKRLEHEVKQALKRAIPGS
jgi:very-short-patch-repair endonuclease